MTCTHIGTDPTRMFCQHCGRVLDKAALKASAGRILGFVGVTQSTSPKLEKFWATGDPTDV